MASSKPVLLDRREGILRRALLTRRVELQKSWKHFIPTKCLESLGSFAPEVEPFLSGQDSIRDWQLAATFTWVNCDANFLDCLRAIALARKIEYHPSDRYRCPLNIGIMSELDVAEELLRQLMVPDRAKLQTGAECDVDEVLLKLNLVGIRALITRDLRYFDALNYFYELPRRPLTRMRTNPHLLAFWLCIYAQLLCTPDWLKCELP